jgi:hypothetical protein
VSNYNGILEIGEYMKIIKYEDFRADLLANVDFSKTERINGDYDKANAYCGMLCVDDGLSNAVYALNKGETSDYFYFNGVKMCFVGIGLACYGDTNVFRNIMGYGYQRTVDGVRLKLKKAIAAYKDIYAHKDVEWLKGSFDMSFDMKSLANNAYDELKQAFQTRVKHMIDCHYTCSNIIGGSFVNVDKWDFKAFDEVFKLDEALDDFINVFDPDAINGAYHAKAGIRIAGTFRDCKKIKDGLQLSESWVLGCSDGDYFGSEHRYGRYCEELWGAVKRMFKYFNNYKGLEALDGFLAKKLNAGDECIINGIKLKVFKSHYTLLFPSSEMNQILVYVNKYAKSNLEFQMGRNPIFKKAA